MHGLKCYRAQGICCHILQIHFGSSFQISTCWHVHGHCILDGLAENCVNFSFNKISGLINLQRLQISWSKVTDIGINFLKGTVFFFSKWHRFSIFCLWISSLLIVVSCFIYINFCGDYLSVLQVCTSFLYWTWRDAQLPLHAWTLFHVITLLVLDLFA